MNLLLHFILLKVSTTFPVELLKIVRCLKDQLLKVFRFKGVRIGVVDVSSIIVTYRGTTMGGKKKKAEVSKEGRKLLKTKGKFNKQNQQTRNGTCSSK